MDDDELQMLQRQFMSVQQQKTNPLSQRTVAQIMVKLHHQGFRFYPTTDGNQYLTPQKLDKQILDLVIERGNINIGILPQILNVGLDTIETRVIKLLTKHSSQSTSIQLSNTILSNSMKLFRHNSLLLSQKYLQSIISTIKQTLTLQGRVNLQTIALDNEFNIKFTEKFIKENLEIINAQLINNQLVTKEYNKMKKMKLLGFIRAIGNPISFQNLLKSSKLGESDDNRTVEMLLEQIISENRVKGKYQNSYYIPDSFIVSQKQNILEFFNNNGFIEFQMLQKQFLVSKPQEWLKKHLIGQSNSKEAPKYILFQDLCVKKQKLHAFANQIQDLLKSQGFLQLSQVLPFNLQEAELEEFLTQNCQLGDYFLFEGFCYSENWLGRVVEEFKEKIFKSIFNQNSNSARRDDARGGKKKGGKKQQKANLIEENELVQKLYNEGLAEYSVAQNIAPALLPILIKKLQDQKKKIEKQLSQNRGILNNTFLKYKSCNSIIKSMDSLQRNLNIIEKQRKKNNEQWTDKQFGPNQNDQKGLYSVVYFDGIWPKGWPASEQNLRWQSFGLKPNLEMESKLTASSSLFGELLSSISLYNNKFSKQTQLSSPLVPSKQLQNTNPEAPMIFSFYRNENDRRHVIIDNKLPIINDKLIGHSGIIGMAEKAYAKFRYCYKGTFNVNLGITSLGVKTLLLQMTGRQPVSYTIQKNSKNILQVVKESITLGKYLIAIAQGQYDKRVQVDKVEGQQNEIELYSMKPYLCINQSSQSITLVNSMDEYKQQIITTEQFIKTFKNLYIL